MRVAYNFVCAIASFVLCLPGTSLAENSVEVDGAGGSRAPDSMCPAGQALTGVNLDADDYVRGIEGRCTLMNADGSSASGVTVTARMGQRGGPAFARADCRAGSVVSGLDIVAAGPVYGVSIVCRPLGPDGRVRGDEMAHRVQGLYQYRMKPEGAPDSSDRRSCPDALPAVGFFGRVSGTHVESLGLRCAGNLDLSAPAITSLTVSPEAVVGGATLEGRVQLSRGALANGAPINIALNPNSSLLSLSVNPLIIGRGDTLGTFRIRTSAVPQLLNITASASLAGQTRTASFQVVPPRIASFNAPQFVAGGSPISVEARLNGATPLGGMFVPIAVNNASVTNLASPHSIHFAHDPNQPIGVTQFTVGTRPVTADTVVTLSSGAVNRNFTVRFPRVASLTVTPQLIPFGTQANAVVQLTGPAAALDMGSSNPTATAVTPGSGNPAIAGVGGLVIVPGGQSSAGFSVTGNSNPPAPGCTTVSATLGTTMSQYVGVIAPQSGTVGFTPPVVTVPAYSGGTLTLRNEGSVIVGSGTFSSSAGNVVVRGRVPLLAPLRSAQIDITTTDMGCAIVTANTDRGVVSALVIVTAPIQG